LKELLSIIWVLSPFLGFSQNNIPTGSWRTHYSFNSTLSVTKSSQDIYAASASGLFIVHKNDKSISSITKLNGLSETGITQIGYNSTSSTLLITYDNGQIDLLKDNLMGSIPDIRLSNMLNSKTTYHMYEYEIFTYLSTGFGLVQIDTEASIIKESFLNLSSTGDNLIIYSSTIYNDSLFLATENGIIAGSLNDNLKDFSKWKRFDVSSGINNEITKVMGLFKDKPVTGNSSQGLLTYNDGEWNASGELIGADFSSIETDNENLIITTNEGVYILTNTGLTQIQSSYITKPNYAIIDDAIYWIADNQNGLIRINGSLSESIYPNGPFFNDITHLRTVNNKIFAFPEFKAANGLPLKNNFGFSVFENGIWSSYNSTGYPNTQSIPEFLDISGVSSLSSGEIIFSSFGYGLLTWNDDVFDIIDESNSPLVNSLPPERNVLIADIDTDNTKLWVLNNNTTSSLQVFNNDKSWTTFNPSSSISNADQIISTPWGDQWITINPNSGGGIVVHNESNQEITLKSLGLGTIPSKTINCIVLFNED